jgi:epoxyqueuosine reductase QueG
VCQARRLRASLRYATLAILGELTPCTVCEGASPWNSFANAKSDSDGCVANA